MKLDGAGARRIGIGFIYTLIVIQTGEVVCLVRWCVYAGRADGLVDAGREMFCVVIGVVGVSRTPIEVTVAVQSQGKSVLSSPDV